MAQDSISLGDLKARMEAAEAELLQAEEAVRQAIARRDRLRTAFQVFEELLAGSEGETPSSPAPPLAQVSPVPTNTAKRARTSKKPRPLTVAERAVEVLEANGAPLETSELVERMQRNGYKPTSKGRPYDTVYGSLHSDAKKPGSLLVNRDAKWGLRKWLESEQESQG